MTLKFNNRAASFNLKHITMYNASEKWSKHTLKIYLLLLCAQADLVLTQEELAFIKHKTNTETFDPIYQEFIKDDEDIRIEKLEAAIGKLEYSQMELADLKKEIHELFNSDKKFSAAERYLDKILDNIVY